MKELMSLPACERILEEYPDMEEACLACGCDGIEIIWGGEPLPENMPQRLRVGYHLTFHPDWLDFWLGDERTLLRKFGSLDRAEDFYGGANGRETLLRTYREDLKRAERWGAKYVVFHVSDVSLDEGYTYVWEHSDEQVLDASIEILNLLFSERDYPFTLLVENQWWPGFTFTVPEKTRYLLDAIHRQDKGIMLDTGHLLNANTGLRTEKQGVDYIHRMLDIHGDLCSCIEGLHLHASLSGEYVESCGGTLPPDWDAGQDYVERFGVSYGHILQIDRHSPWTDPVVSTVAERISPRYLVHELSASCRVQREEKIRTQRGSLGYQWTGDRKSLHGKER